MALLSRRISTKTLVPLCRQLATSYSAGIPILNSLELVRNHFKATQAREMLGKMQDDIRDGSTLGQAARNHKDYLPVFLIELLSSGEKGGRLDVMLNDLANYYEDRLSMQRTVIGKMTYPALQLVAAWFLGTFALCAIRRMSFMSASSFSLSGYLKWYAGFQMAACLVFATLVVVCIVLARMGLFKWVWGYAATYIWPLAPVTRRFAMARFFRSMALLTASGVSVTRCIRSAAATTANPYIERDFLQALPLVQNGATLVEAFSSSKFLSPQAREMLLVGEQSGKLEDSLQKASEYNMNEAVHAVNVASRIGEVLIILGVCCAVGFVIISFYSNYYGRMFDELGI